MRMGNDVTVGLYNLAYMYFDKGINIFRKIVDLYKETVGKEKPNIVESIMRKMVHAEAIQNLRKESNDG